MAIYVGPLPAGPGVVPRSYCFSAGAATLLRVLIVAADAIFGAVVGLIVGALLALLGDFPAPFLLAIAGGLLGAALGLTIITMGACHVLRELGRSASISFF